MPPVAFHNESAIPSGFWVWPHISPKEWADRLTDEIVVVPEFMTKLETLRLAYGKPFIFASCYRTPEHNQIVSATSSSDGAHTVGLAADIKIYGAHALELLALALSQGFTGIGISQKGPQASRFLHVDCAPDRDNAPRPTIWSY